MADIFDRILQRDPGVLIARSGRRVTRFQATKLLGQRRSLLQRADDPTQSEMSRREAARQAETIRQGLEQSGWSILVSPQGIEYDVWPTGRPVPPHLRAQEATTNPGKLERMWKHIYASAIERGQPEAVARRIASATVNRHRAERAARGQGPLLVGQGGSRRQWYPGKRRS